MTQQENFKSVEMTQNSLRMTQDTLKQPKYTPETIARHIKLPSDKLRLSLDTIDILQAIPKQPRIVPTHKDTITKHVRITQGDAQCYHLSPDNHKGKSHKTIKVLKDTLRKSPNT